MLLNSLLKTLKYAAYILIFVVALVAFMVLGVWSVSHHPFVFVITAFIVLLAVGTMINYHDARLQARKDNERSRSQ